MLTVPKFPYPLGQFMNQQHHNGCHGGVDAHFVKTWQLRMQERGWHLKADGCFGPQTEKVCREFQAKRGLTIDGQVGRHTWNAAWVTPPKEKSWRDKVALWHETHLGITEQPLLPPPGSNCDFRADGIRTAQDGCANGTWLRHEPWCGVWAWAGLHAAGLVPKGASWMALVSSIEDHARAHTGPFRGWTTDGSLVKKGDLVILFGRGVHAGTVRYVDDRYVYTWEGNTSSSSHGSQSNGGGSYRRTRARHVEVYGYALVRGN